MKLESIKVTRTIEVAGQSDTERETSVNFRKAESAGEMLEICGGNVVAALEFFNAGRWAELRTKVSNALAGKSKEQKSVEKMVAAFRAINAALTEEQARTIVLSMPGMVEASAANVEVLPKVIEDTYFDEKKAAKTANAEVPAEGEVVKA